MMRTCRIASINNFGIPEPHLNVKPFKIGPGGELALRRLHRLSFPGTRVLHEHSATRRPQGRGQFEYSVD